MAILLLLAIGAHAVLRIEYLLGCVSLLARAKRVPLAPLLEGQFICECHAR